MARRPRSRRGNSGRLAPWAHIDVDRERRTGVPEVVLAEGKDPAHIVAIVRAFVEQRGEAIISRVGRELVPRLRRLGELTYVPTARIAIVRRRGSGKPLPRRAAGGRVCILGAGTSDFRVGEEARVIAEALGCTVTAHYDVGVAGIHRLFAALEHPGVRESDVFIVAAGRDGVLPSVVAGLVDAPVIGLPVSTGYGAGGKGEAALHAMLQACAPLAVVNVDAGFVAGAVAAQIARRASRGRRGRTGR